MAYIDKSKKLRPSILDRLLDDAPHNRLESEPDRYQNLKTLRQSVRRDLEQLLNTRYRIVSPPSGHEQLEHSLLNYGLPDLATINIIDADQKKEFIRHMERVIRTYEPRFKSVKVTHHENKDKTDRALRFRIDAVLYADPSPEIVVFDSVLESVTRSVSVTELGHG